MDNNKKSNVRFGEKQRCSKCGGYNPSGLKLPEECIWCNDSSSVDLSKINQFQIGTVIRNKLNNHIYVVTDNINGILIATQTIAIYNSDEWEKET